MGFSFVGTVLAILLLSPSILFFIKFPTHMPQNNKPVPKIFDILEKLGQAGCIISLIISRDFFLLSHFNIFMALMISCIILYYSLWIMTFKKGGDFSIMLRPFGFIPIPGAVLPVCAFVFAALWGKCLWLGASALFLAVGHCVVTWNSYVQMERK